MRDITIIHPVPFSAYPDDVTSRSQVLAPAFVILVLVQGGSNMTGTDLCVNKPHCAAAV